MKLEFKQTSPLLKYKNEVQAIKIKLLKNKTTAKLKAKDLKLSSIKYIFYS